MKKDEPMRNINPFGLRMQHDLRAKVEAAAARNHRSLNAEIIARLEESFSQPVSDLDAEDQERRDKIRERLWQAIDEAIDEALKQETKGKE